MNLATPVANLAVLGVVVAGAIGIGRTGEQSRAPQIGAGATAAVAAMVVLLALRSLLPVARAPAVAWLTVVVLLEEGAKLLAVWASGATGNAGSPGSRGAAVGLGFAATENLLYILAPTGLILLRFLTAGTIHVATTWLYGRALHPAPDHRHTHGVPRPRIALPVALTIGALGHLAYNLIARSLDQILTVW